MTDCISGTHSPSLGAPSENVNRHTYLEGRQYAAMSAGARIKKLRKAAHMSGPALAALMQIKPPSLWEIENGETKTLKAETLMLAAKALRANPAYLLWGVGSPVESINPNDDEAEVLDKYRRMVDRTKAAWLAIGDTLIAAQATKPQPAPAPVADEKKKTAKR